MVDPNAGALDPITRAGELTPERAITPPEGVDHTAG